MNTFEELEIPMVADADAYRAVKRDWVTLLAPGIIAALISVGSTIAVGSYYMGGLNQRLVVVEGNIEYVKHDYVSKEQFERTLKSQEDVNAEFRRNNERINDKLDVLVDRSNGGHRKTY